MVEVLTADDARRRRDDLLHKAGVEESALRERAAAYALSAEELAVLDELDSLDYLLSAS